MDGNPFDLQRRAAGPSNSLPVRAIRQRRVEFKNLVTRASSVTSPAKLLDLVLPQTDRSGRYESAVGRSNSFPSERAIHITGSFVKRIIDVTLSGIAFLFL